ncbi:MAG: hypothetical protein OEX00_02720 [Gammaproteobacteria bacterium]|nr:hypothetical protein [Gammaproteobacteria bacterium]MDH5694297.1 hypothetical protein [Gammaproteobacteria bacterium]
MSADKPVINGCYLDIGGEMYKVRMLDLSGDQIRHVVMEDTLSRCHRLTLKEWLSLSLIPICLSWNAEPSYVCYQTHELNESQA